MKAPDSEHADGRPEPDGARTVLMVELDSGDRLGGWVSRDRGDRIRFEGMLDFFALFERLRQDMPGPPPEP